MKDKETILIGVMSGTSLDGLDVAACRFTGNGQNTGFEIIKAVTYPYSELWQQRLESIHNSSAEKYFAMNAMYGKYIGEKVKEFLKEDNLKPMAIASHGHTVFHQPHAGFSTQIGCGASISAETGLQTICDFRSTDVAYGGQGAPLVPIGDRVLFSKYQACLNIGGIANISFEKNGHRVAYDICVANMLLNFLASAEGHAYDDSGNIARAGVVDEELLRRVSENDYYEQGGARSLGREWFEKNMKNIYEESSLKTPDLLATATEQVARTISKEIRDNRLQNVLVSGGGAHNAYLIEKLREYSGAEIVIPDRMIIDFKEALIFAFLGYLRLNGMPNALASVTGAVKDSVGGALYLA